jgi:hypothetical protein
MNEAFQRLRQARMGQGYDTASAAADAFGWNRNTYASNENGNAPFSYRKAKEYARRSACARNGSTTPRVPCARPRSRGSCA